MNVANNIGQCCTVHDEKLNKIKLDLTFPTQCSNDVNMLRRSLLVDVGPAGEQASINSRSIFGFYIEG